MVLSAVQVLALSLLGATLILEWYRRWVNKMLGIVNVKDIHSYLKDNWSDDKLALEIITQIEKIITKEQLDQTDLYYIYESFNDEVPLAACHRKAQAEVLAESFGIKDPFITKDKPGELERSIRERRERRENSNPTDNDN